MKVTLFLEIPKFSFKTVGQAESGLHAKTNSNHSVSSINTST